jgi:teichuronic acid biosynthesis glycosyltransferase TuaC
MKILFLSMWYPNSENPVSGTFVHEQAEALRKEGVEVRVMQPIPIAPFPVTLFKPSYRALAAIPDEELYDGHPIYHPRYLTLPGHRMYDRVGDWMYRAIRQRMLSIYQEWSFDIIHAHATYPCGYAANRCRDELFPRVKVLHTIHRTCIIDAPNYSPACFEKVRTGLEGANANVFVSKEGMALGLKYTSQRIAGRSQYITNGVNTERFSLNTEEQNEVEALKAAHPDTFNIVFVGYLKEVKGIKELLEAIKDLVASGRRNLRLFLVGDNQMGTYVDDYLQRYALSDVVIRVGAVPHQRVKIWMRFASAFILPSHSEGTPTVLFEALFVGAPSIFTQVGGVGDIVTDGQEALLIPPRSIPAIKSAICTLVDDPKLCQQIAARGYKLISSQYTWPVNAHYHKVIYDKLLK